LATAFRFLKYKNEPGKFYCTGQIPADFQLQLLSAAMIIAWIIPGYSLQKNINNKKPDHGR
jgi:hypothetical protein